MVLLFFGIPDKYADESKVQLLYRYIDRRGCSCRCDIDYCNTRMERLSIDGQLYYILPISTSWELSTIQKCLDFVVKYEGIKLKKLWWTQGCRKMPARPIFLTTWFLKLSDPARFFFTN